MKVYLVRHAKAGSRASWRGDDRERPLSKPGRRQADALVAVLAPAAPARILSSPYLRCVQTVEPLAKKLGIDIHHREELAEGAPYEASWHTVHADASDAAVVICSHGDVIGDVLLHAVSAGVELPGHRLEKGCVWVLEMEDGRPIAARYLPPPQVA